jgi:MYXO-CTERM domain-containing protein
LVALVLLASGRLAVASDPLSTYTVPSLVELQPDDTTATRVVIHGAFFNLTSAANFTYADPKCGVMHFQCVAGQEDMCRMQWTELRAAISPTPTLCYGFGTREVLTTATLYAEGQPLGTPDAWDLGMGIGQGVYLDNKCPAARMLTCPFSGPGTGGAAGGSGGGAGKGAGGAAGGGGIGSGAAGASGGAAGEIAGQGGDTIGPGGSTAGTGGGAAGAGGAAAGKGGAGTAGRGAVGGAAGTAGETKPGRGCAIADGETSSGAPLFLLALVALVSGARRRRR